MDSNYLMSTSVLQYLEEMNNYLKDNQVTNNKDRVDLLVDQSIVEEEDYKPGVDFDVPDEREMVFAPDFLNKNESDELFANKLSLDDDCHATDGPPNDVVMNGYDKEEKKELQSKVTEKSDSKEKSGTTEDSQNNKSEESSKGKKIRVPNKVRARKARNRKKQYYEDLEKRAEHLEKRCQDLEKELEYCKNKLKIYELSKKNMGDINLGEIDQEMFQNIKKRLGETTDDSELFTGCCQISNAYGPFGTEKVKILDRFFDSILENMLCGGCLKLNLYAVDRKIPTSKAEFESYSKMKKYRQYDTYPDENIRNFINAHLSFNYTTEQYNDILKNGMKAVKSVKDQMQNGVTYLFKARDEIYKSLMMYEMVRSTFSSTTVTKEQFLLALDNVRNSDVKISSEDIFNINKRDVEVEPILPISDPKTFKKLRVMNGMMDPNDEPPTEVKQTYLTTVYTSG